MKKTLLVIGDPMMTDKVFDRSLNRFITQKPRINKRGIGVIFITYNELMSGRLPNISTKKLEILLFFPYNFWNNEVENYSKDRRIYGDIKFGSDFGEYFSRAHTILRNRYRKKTVRFINPPKACIIDRDKLKTYLLLKSMNINSPHIYEVKNIWQVNSLLKKGIALYAKPRFGAMGKGITYITKNATYTNFLFKSNWIVNRLYDYNWRPVKISEKKRNAFLRILIERGFIFQEAVNPLIYKGRKFDIRVYTVFGKVPYYYAKSAPAESFITNWSQGGRIEPKGFLNASVSKKEIKQIQRAAKKAAKAIGLKFAGVDVIIDRHTGRMHVLEIQSFPGYERGFDLMKFLADSI